MRSGYRRSGYREGCYWTQWIPEDDVALIELWGLDVPVAEIARTFGRTPGSINQRVQRLGLPKRRRLGGTGERPRWVREEPRPALRVVNGGR